jgi:hypothetical protein
MSSLPGEDVDRAEGAGQKPRYHRMILGLRFATRLAFVAAVAGMLLPGKAGRSAGALAVTVVVSVPLLRVLWLAIRWWRPGRDRRYSLVATGLLAVVGAGAVVALLTR